MKNVVLIFLFCLLQLTAFSQKVTVKVIKLESAALSEWQILDGDYNIVFNGNEYYRTDSVILTLEANKRYILSISVSEIITSDTKCYSLIMNDEPLIVINTDAGTGDHFYPFFTGIRVDANKIIGGTNAAISDFPWQVYYISGNFRCGGSIIADTWIVTAAHCTKNSFGTAIPASSMLIKVGATNSTNPAEGQLYNVSEVIVNELYDSQSLEYDIALLRLKQPINYPNAKPIKLISSDDVAYGHTDPGVMTWVTGWGLTQINPNVTPSVLQKVQLPIVSNAQASTVWGSIPSTAIMAGYQNGNKDACNGDSGGPMAVTVFGSYKLAGLVSWGSQNCNTYGGYTSISKLEYWIRQKTGIPKDYIPPVPVGDTLICSGVLSSQYTVSPIAGATSYEWQLSPEEAGVISWNNENAIVTWDSSFIGSGTLILRATVNGVVSEWSRLYLKVVPVTSLLKQSTGSAICEGSGVTLSVTAEGYNLNYKWYKDAALIQSGISPAINIKSATPSGTGIYKCQVTGYCNNSVSDDIELIVYPTTKVTSISPDVSVIFGSDAVIEVSTEGHNLVYQWHKDGINIENSNFPILFLYDLNASGIGLYNITLTGTCGTFESSAVYVYVKTNGYSGEPEVFLWPSVTEAEFSIALSNDETYSIYIYNTSGQLVKEITNCRYETNVNVSPLGKGTYIAKVFNSGFRKSLRFIKL